MFSLLSNWILVLSFLQILKTLFLACKRELTWESNHRRSLSSHNMALCGIKLLRTFRTNLLKIQTFSLTFVFEKALSQLKSCSSNEVSFCFFKMPNLSWIWWWEINFHIKFCQNNLVMVTWMKGRMNTWFDYQVWLRRKN